MLEIMPPPSNHRSLKIFTSSRDQFHKNYTYNSAGFCLFNTGGNISAASSFALAATPKSLHEGSIVVPEAISQLLLVLKEGFSL